MGKIPVILFDLYDVNNVLGMVMIPEGTKKSEVRDVVNSVKSKNPNSWDMEEVLLALAEHDDWEVYNCQDILELNI